MQDLSSKYTPEREGDWGVPSAAPGSEYSSENVTCPDEIKLFVRSWKVADPKAPVLVILHGLGAHTGWFIDMGNALNAFGLNVYMYDHRGFGRSGGERGHVERAARLLDDAAHVVAVVAHRHPGARIFVLGHSMGALLATNAAVRDAESTESHIAGLIVVNPWIRDVVKVSPAFVFRSIAAGMRGSSKVMHRPSDTALMTLNADATRLLANDPNWVKNQTAAFLYQITRVRLAVMKLARSVNVPTLVIQCLGDATVSHDASRKFFDAIAASDKEWKTYDGFGHDFEFERDRAVLDTDIARWIARH